MLDEMRQHSQQSNPTIGSMTINDVGIRKSYCQFNILFNSFHFPDMKDTRIQNPKLSQQGRM